MGNYMSAQDKPAPRKEKSELGKTKQVRTIKEDPSDNVKVTVKDYKIISFARDTTFLDTTLTIKKEYKYNYLRKDDFELMPFANIGQPYNKLGVSFERKNNYPKLGAKARHFNYAEMAN